jgi:hypothetical protein
MRKLPLATLGAATALGLLATVAQAEPVTLTPSQMDELTAGASLSVSINVLAATAAATAVESTGEGSAAAQAAAANEISVSVEGSAEDD